MAATQSTAHIAGGQRSNGSEHTTRTGNVGVSETNGVGKYYHPAASSTRPRP